jgi:hypothetical protein
VPRGVFTPWSFLPPFNFGAPGTANTQGGGGGMGPYFRDALDARRSMYNQDPQAQYPDGYLGTINTRRGDRLLDNLKQRQNQRAYQRGVHKGERIDPSDYFWSSRFNPQTSLQLESQGEKFSPIGSAMPMYSPRQQSLQGATAGLGNEAMRRLAPAWR